MLYDYGFELRKVRPLLSKKQLYKFYLFSLGG